MSISVLMTMVYWEEILTHENLTGDPKMWYEFQGFKYAMEEQASYHGHDQDTDEGTFTDAHNRIFRDYTNWRYEH